MEIPSKLEADAFPIGRSMLLGTGVALALALAVAGSVYLSMIGLRIYTPVCCRPSSHNRIGDGLT
jgi:hypothetical protein